MYDVRCMMYVTRRGLVFVAGILLLVACNSNKEKSKQTDQKDTSQTVSPVNTDPAPDTPKTAVPGSNMSKDNILENAKAIVGYIKSKEFDKVAKYVSPTRGLRFSMESYIQPDDRLFFPAGVAGLWDNMTKYKWGEDEGGEMNGTFREYYADHLYNKDFATQAEIGLNKVLRGGTNCLVNTEKIYKDYVNVDFYCKFTKPEEELDWSTLRLIFTEENGGWYLRHIIHDHWCI